MIEKSKRNRNDSWQRKRKKVSLTATVRRDLSEGYYKVPVIVMDKSGNDIGYADLRVWITKSTSTSTNDDDDDTNKTYDFVLGEGRTRRVVFTRMS